VRDRYLERRLERIEETLRTLLHIVEHLFKRGKCRYPATTGIKVTKA
jgi:hypothetical protein